jgi:hypothetical protein
MMSGKEPPPASTSPLPAWTPERLKEIAEWQLWLRRLPKWTGQTKIEYGSIRNNEIVAVLGVAGLRS